MASFIFMSIQAVAYMNECMREKNLVHWPDVKSAKNAIWKSRFVVDDKSPAGLGWLSQPR